MTTFDSRWIVPVVKTDPSPGINPVDKSIFNETAMNHIVNHELVQSGVDAIKHSVEETLQGTVANAEAQIAKLATRMRDAVPVDLNLGATSKLLSVYATEVKRIQQQFMKSGVLNKLKDPLFMLFFQLLAKYAPRLDTPDLKRFWITYWLSYSFSESAWSDNALNKGTRINTEGVTVPQQSFGKLQFVPATYNANKDKLIEGGTSWVKAALGDPRVRALTRSTPDRMMEDTLISKAGYTYPNKYNSLLERYPHPAEELVKLPVELLYAHSIIVNIYRNYKYQPAVGWAPAPHKVVNQARWRDYLQKVGPVVRHQDLGLVGLVTVANAYGPGYMFAEGEAKQLYSSRWTKDTVQYLALESLPYSRLIIEQLTHT